MSLGVLRAKDSTHRAPQFIKELEHWSVLVGAMSLMGFLELDPSNSWLRAVSKGSANFYAQHTLLEKCLVLPFPAARPLLGKLHPPQG